ncbi:reverse transcriptase family protein [Dickeya undicola]|uniref:reverse transcriptase family protein n=1 Tax=Dickeya TaxID=204037 RepID=UPI0002E2354A|nr:reverse transcriptase family protein [Dickeya zeae]AJC66962.1 hypothetical protein W909_13120 [Dickeya zeae EC1]
MRIKPKLKIITRSKEYNLTDSPLYKINSKRKLAKIINVDFNTLKSLKDDKMNYSIFDQVSKKGKVRKIQKPVQRLDIVHTRIASLLCRIATPSYLHSGKKHHSNITNADVHKNEFNLLTTDIKSFFPSTKRSMVFSFFLTVMKTSPDVADILSHLCTCHNHIPTGSRISMPLAFWANVRMFEELKRLCSNLDITMTVYVDDITFSGENVNRLFVSCVKKIIVKHGHQMHPTKTKFYNSTAPKLVTGVIVVSNCLKVRNEQHQLFANEFEQWRIIKEEPHAINANITNKLIGRLYSMGVIEKRFKEKVRTVKNSTAL